MSEQTRETSILILRIIGSVLIFITVILGVASVACIFGWESPNMAARCADGSVKEVAFTIIGAVGALWGASMMKGEK